MQTASYDLVVIGGGPAGVSGALAAAVFGKRAAVVEMESRVGGAGINTGTIPSKALRESASLISGWRARKILGLDVAMRSDATVPNLTLHQAKVRDAICSHWESRMDVRSVEKFHGKGAFVDPHTVRVIDENGNQTILSGKQILIATGSSPFHPSEFPFEHHKVHDSNEILGITDLPRSLAVVGAGVIGAEYACTFAALGITVHLLDQRDTLLPFLDPEISASIMKAMQKAGVRFHWNEKVISCSAPPQGNVVLKLASGTDLAVSDVLIAAGRTSNTSDLNLAAAGITPGTRGLIPVNEVFRTVVPHIYAAGDVVGPPALAATGMEQARVAICNAFELIKKETASLLPTGIYTIPEASMVGQTEQALKDAGVDYFVGRAHYSDNPRGRLIGDEEGLLKLIFRRDDMRLLGVHAVGEQATELVHIGLIAMLSEASADLFSRACFNYPTLGDLYKYASYDAMLQHAGRA